MSINTYIIFSTIDNLRLLYEFQAIHTIFPKLVYSTPCQQIIDKDESVDKHYQVVFVSTTERSLGKGKPPGP